MSWVLSLLEKLGRKYALVDYYGDVLFYRYFPLWVERHDSKRKWPNVFIHVFPGEPGGLGIDGPVAHRHPYSAVGFVLRGSYTEVLNNTRTRVNRAPALAYTSYLDDHRITHATPGTLSVWVHGPRVQAWVKVGYPHKEICPACRAYNGGRCYIEPGVSAFPTIDPADNPRRWRGTTWMKVTPDMPALLRARGAALRALGVENPVYLGKKIEAEKVRQLKERNRVG